MPIHFSNPGALPLEAITTLGISVKEGPNPIGRFGTGLKYTIAGILRLGESITIETGGRRYSFTATTREVRGKDFQFVQMHDDTGEVRELGFTTDLGKHWEPWMFIRELYSNCRDEGGTFGEGTGPEPSGGSTRILIAGKTLEEVFRERNKYILSDRAARRYTTTVNAGEVNIEILEKIDPASSIPTIIFYQGIRVATIPRPSLYDYNILTKVALTEDRTLSSEHIVFGALGDFYSYTVDDEDLLEEYLTRPTSGTVENEAYIWRSDSTLKTVLERIYRKSPIRLREKARHVAYEWFKPSYEDMTFDLSPLEQAKFDRALKFLRTIGYDKEIKWGFVNPDDAKAWGFADMRNETAYIYRRAFESGTQFLAQVMLEEYLHITTGQADYTREMQDTLFSKIISLGEELQGEPL